MGTKALPHVLSSKSLRQLNGCCTEQIEKFLLKTMAKSKEMRLCAIATAVLLAYVSPAAGFQVGAGLYT